MSEGKPDATGHGFNDGTRIDDGAPVYGEDDADAQIRDLGRAESGDSDADDEFADEEQPGRAAPGGLAGVEILTRLLDLMGLEGDVISEQTENSLILNIEGDDLGVLIGRRGLTLAALQYVVRLMIASRESEWPSVSVDVCGYKKRRHVALEELARRLADQAKYRRRPVTLEPMPPDERRVVHLALANNPDVYTESVGEDVERKVVIHPKKV